MIRWLYWLIKLLFYLSLEWSKLFFKVMLAPSIEYCIQWVKSFCIRFYERTAALKQIISFLVKYWHLFKKDLNRIYWHYYNTYYTPFYIQCLIEWRTLKRERYAYLSFITRHVIKPLIDKLVKKIYLIKIDWAFDLFILSLLIGIFILHPWVQLYFISFLNFLKASIVELCVNSWSYLKWYYPFYFFWKPGT